MGTNQYCWIFLRWNNLILTPKITSLAFLCLGRCPLGSTYAAETTTLLYDWMLHDKAPFGSWIRLLKFTSGATIDLSREWTLAAPLRPPTESPRCEVLVIISVLLPERMVCISGALLSLLLKVSLTHSSFSLTHTTTCWEGNPTATNYVTISWRGSSNIVWTVRTAHSDTLILDKLAAISNILDSLYDSITSLHQ